jgi:Tfp pilus assembly protein PilE
MTRAIRERSAEDAGLALIELMAGVMAIAILVAIAIPAVFGFHRTAQDRAAQSEIGSVLASEQALWLERGEYSDEAADLTALQPSVVIHDSDPQAGVTITLNSPTSTLCIERVSASGATFSLWESADRGTFYGRGGGLTGACPEAAPAGYTPGGW